MNQSIRRNRSGWLLSLRRLAATGLSLLFVSQAVHAQIPLPSNYGIPTKEATTEVLSRIHAYLDQATPAQLVNRNTNEPITDYSQPNADAVIARGSFQLVSYEWGVTYSGMLAATEATQDPKYKQYVATRMKFLVDTLPMFREQALAAGRAFGRGGLTGRGAGVAPATAPARGPATRGARGGGGARGPAFMYRSIVMPGSLDDSGSMCAAMIKATLANIGTDLRPEIDTYMKWVFETQKRFSDGTLARDRPLPDTLWLDDLYMSVPALAQMGKLTGEQKYYDDACRQILQFADRMFVKEKGLWMHGWTMQSEDHPAFHWARANGWALMAMTELLSVLPENHPQRGAILSLYKAHVKGLSKLQDQTGLWHQLLDRPDSYLETSAAAIYVYCLARGINRGWINATDYGPIAHLGWSGVTSKVNAQGQVEGTCVGTGMGFDVAFYYARPTNVLAAHGYGPVLLAGAEMIKLEETVPFNINDGAVMRAPVNAQ